MQASPGESAQGAVRSVRDERGHVAHRTDWHDRDYMGYGCQDIIFTRADDGTLTVDCQPDSIMASNELVQAMRDAITGTRVDKNNLLRIVAVNADLSYELQRLGCGCWLGRLLR